MRLSSAAILSLITLATANATGQATAAPVKTPTQPPKANSVVIPVISETPAGIEAVSPPESVISQQFSQNTVSVQTTVKNNSVVAVTPTPKQTTKVNSPVVLPPSAPISTPTPRPSTPTTGNDLVVTATDVQVVGATPELQQIISKLIQTQAGGETSQTQLQRDVAAILDTGLFANARVNTRNTNTGLSVVYEVQPIIVRSLEISGGKALTYQVALEGFQPLVGSPISPTALSQKVQQINQWYADNGYSLGRVVSIVPTRQGVLNLNVAEGVVGDIKFRFLNEKGEAVDAKGKPIAGRTKSDFLLQQLKLKPGQVFQDNAVRQDLQRLYATGLFESVNIALEGDATKLELVYQLKEAGARSVNVGGNYSADQGIIGTLNYQDRNFGGVNETLGVNVGAGTRDFQFDTRFSSPYRVSKPDTLGYSINAFRNRGLSDTFDEDIKLANGDKVRQGKIGGSISLQQPISGWDTSLGFNYTRTSIRDGRGNITPTDAKGNPLSFSGTGIDDLATVSFTAAKDKRDNPLNPTQGSVVSFSTEQSVPLGQGSISMNRLKANYSQYVPVNIFNSKQGQVFALNLQGGTVIGDLPPYETFNLGGLNSVRGYGSGDVASGRSYVLASAEYRFPILQAIGGVLFADYASDLGSGNSVLGNPAGMRGKPGNGFGYGAGVRLNSPLGLLRADYGISDQGETKLQFGVGQRF